MYDKSFGPKPRGLTSFQLAILSGLSVLSVGGLVSYIWSVQDELRELHEEYHRLRVVVATRGEKRNVQLITPKAPHVLEYPLSLTWRDRILSNEKEIQRLKSLVVNQNGGEER